MSQVSKHGNIPKDEKTEDNMEWQNSERELDPNRILTNEEIQYRNMKEGRTIKKCHI